MATSPSANPTPITPPRVPLIDARTGMIDRAWYMFFLSLFDAAGIAIDNQNYGPPVQDVSGQLSNLFSQAQLASEQPSLVQSLQAELDSVKQQLQTLSSDQTAQLQAQLDALRQELQTLPKPDLGTMAPLQQDNLPWVVFDTTPQNVPVVSGAVAWDGGTTLGVQATANVLIKVGEAEYIYAKASSAITKGQVCYHTGAVGASGVITVAPSPIGMTDPNQIVGIAAESIALNDFGLILISGDIKGFDTTGSSVGEVWADGDPLYYNPAFVGSMTKVKPSAPNIKTYMGEVISAGPGGSGSMHVRIVPGSVLGGTDSNVQFGTLNNNDLIQYDSVLQYWKNIAAASVTVGYANNLKGGAAGSVPYQSALDTTTFLPIGTALQVLKVNAGATAPEWVTGAALTKTDDTNVTLTLGGSASTALLNAASLTLGWTGQLAVSRGGTGVSTATANYVFAGPTSGGAAAPTFRTLVSGDIPALSYVSSVSATAPITSTGGLTPTIGVTASALTKTDDTNVTLTLGGTPATSLLAATSLTLGWTGQLSLARGGTNANLTAAAGAVTYSTATALALNTAGNSGDWLKSGGTGAPVWTAPAALTKTNDTNVTLTLGGSASTALLNAASLTLGWTGQLAVSRGGTGLASLTAGYIPFGSGTSAFGSSSNLFWDNTNARLGIGTVTPVAAIHITTGTKSISLASPASGGGGGSTFIGGNNDSGGTAGPNVITMANRTISFGAGDSFSSATGGTFTSWMALDSTGLSLSSGETYKINGTSVLSATTLGSGVVSSSLTSVGTLATGVWNASTIGVGYGGTGVTTTPANGQLLIGNGTGYTVANLTAGSGVTITNSAGGISIAATGSGGTVTSVSFTGGIISVANPTTTPALTVAGSSGGIPYFSSASTWASSGVLAANALMIGGGAGVAPSTTTTAAGILTFLGTPSSANLAAAVTDETGSGSLVFATSPTLVTPVLGVATATSINKVTITAPATGATLTIADGKTLTANNSLTLAGTDATTMTFPTTDADIARTDAGQTFIGTQTVRAAATQDAVALAGRAGGTSSYVATITPTTLSASRTITLPNLSGTVALLSNTQTFSGTTTFSAATVTVGSSTATSTYGLGTGATISGSTKTVNIGTAGVSGSTTNVTIGSTNGTSVTANGNWSFSGHTRTTAPVTKTANFTVADSETWLINNKSGSSCTVTLPAAASYTGRSLTFQNYQAQTLISASSNVVPQGGGAAGTAILEAVVGNWATLVSDGTNWVIMQAAAYNNLLLE